VRRAIIEILDVCPLASRIARFMKEMDLREYVLSILEFDLPLLVERFKRLKATSEIVRRDIQTKIAGYRNAIGAQFDLFFRTGGFLNLVQ
jgi:hypothetical protein